MKETKYTKNIGETDLYIIFSHILVKAKEVWTKENDISLGRMRTDLWSIYGHIAGPLKRWKRQFMHKKCVEFSRCLSLNSRIISCSKLAAWEVLILLPPIQRNIFVSLFHRFCVCVWFRDGTSVNKTALGVINTKRQ